MKPRYVLVFRGYGVAWVRKRSFWWVLTGRDGWLK